MATRTAIPISLHLNTDMFRTILKAVLRVALVIIGINVIAVGVFMTRSHLSTLPTVSAPMTSDAAVIFFSDPSDTRRLETALSLYRSGLTTDLVFVGGCRPRRAYFGSAALRDRAVRAGVPREALHIGNGSFDTVGNINAIMPIVTQQAYTSLTLVSSKPHLMRIRRALKNRLPSDLNISYAPTPYEGMWSSVWQHQHEVIQALATTLLPDDLYRAALRHRRLGSGAYDQTGLCTAFSGA